MKEGSKEGRMRQKEKEKNGAIEMERR